MGAVGEQDHYAWRIGRAGEHWDKLSALDWGILTYSYKYYSGDEGMRANEDAKQPEERKVECGAGGGP